MNFKKLKDQELHSQLVFSVKEEKKLISQILHLLKEVDNRKLYCDFNCRSLFDYATKILKYSEAEAYTRINAMRLIRQFPEIIQELEMGELTLTNVAQAQSFFRKQEMAVKIHKDQPLTLSTNESVDSTDIKNECLKTKQELFQKHVGFKRDPNKNQFLNLQQKRHVLNRLRNQSTRQAKQILFNHGPDQENNESIKTLDNGRIEIKFCVDENSLKQIQVLKDRYSKPGENLSFELLMQRICEQTIIETTKHLMKDDFSALRKQSVKNKTLTPAVRLQIKQRDGFHCKNCGSTKNLEVDHIKPQALGGYHHSNNLQTLCRPCNQRRAIKTFGIDVVQRATSTL